MKLKPFAAALAAAALLEAGSVAHAADPESKAKPVSATAVEQKGPLEQKGSDEQAADAISEAMKRPQVVITGDGTVARATVDSKFGISIVSNKDGQLTKLPITAVEGLAHVDLAAGQEFRILLVNNADYDVAASVSIDGVNMFAFSEKPEHKFDGKLRIGRSGGFVDGWYYNDGKSRAFQVGKIDDAEKIVDRRKEGIGGMTVAFFADKPVNSAAGNAGPSGTAANSTAVEQGSFKNLIAAVTVRYQKPD